MGKYTYLFCGTALLLWFCRTALLPLWIAAAAAFLLDLPVSRLEQILPLRRERARRGAAVLLTVLLLGSGIALVCVGLLPQLRQSVTALAARLPFYWTKLEARLAALPHRQLILPDMEAVQELLHRIGGNLLPGAWRVTKGLGSALAESVATGLTAAVLCLYFLCSKDTLLYAFRRFSRLLPPHIRDGAVLIAQNARTVFSCYLRSRLLESGFLLLCCLPGLLLCRIPYALLFSVLISIGNLIPFLGSLLTTGFCTILLLAIAPIKALWFFFFILALQQLDNAIIYPRIAGTSLGLPAVCSVTAVLIGARLCGAAGAFLSVPVAALCWRLAEHAIHKRAPTP